MARKKKGGPDYRDFKTVEKRDDSGRVLEKHAAESVTGEYWWHAAEDRRHDAVWAAVDSLEQQQSVRREVNALCARLYGDRDISGLSAHARTAPTDKVTLNIVSMVVDTLNAKIAKQKPKATFVTDGGDWTLQRKAKLLDKFVQGVKHKARFYPKLRTAFRDACWADVGVLKFYRDADGICVDRVFPDELLVDARDGQYGEPRCLYQRKCVPREVLKGLFPKHAEAIDSADAPDALETGEELSSLDDMVEVREAWHLPSGKDAGDGRHALCVSSATLVDEEWKRPRFPFVVLRYSERVSGFYGRGVAERLVGWQRSINRKLRTINEAMRLMASPQYWVQSGADVPVETMTNEVGAIVRSAVKPVLLNERGIVVPPQLIESVQQDVARALEQEGISQLSVSSRKPAGLDSGAALREYNDIESERFILVGQMLEEAAVEAAQQVIDLAEEAAAEKQPLNIAVEGKRGVERIDWQAVDMDADAFVLKAFPTSSLPQTPAARRKAVEEMVEAGWLEPMEARRLLDMPDLEAANSVAFAGRDEVDALVETLLEGGKDDKPETLAALYSPPEPSQDLAYGMKRFQLEYLKAKRLGAPEARLALLRDWMAQAETLLQPEAPPPAGALPPGGAPPALPATAGGMPMPPMAGGMLP